MKTETNKNKNENNTLIQAYGLTKTFGYTTAVSELDLIVEKGEVLALIGANGAGKSTLKISYVEFFLLIKVNYMLMDNKSI